MLNKDLMSIDIKVLYFKYIKEGIYHGNFSRFKIK